jgi:hypothetical protein
MSRILKMKFKSNQQGNGEDLYFCEETKRVYVRQTSNGEGKIVFWLSTSKWSGGYEASCPLKEGLIIQADYIGTQFEEVLVKDDWNGGTSAIKTFPFSWESEKLEEQKSKEISPKQKLKDLFDQHPDLKKAFVESLEELRTDENITKMSREIAGVMRKMSILKEDLNRGK